MQDIRIYANRTIQLLAMYYVLIPTHSATRRWSNVGTWSAWLVERRSWHANVHPTLGQREQPNRWVDMVGPMLARRMIFDGEMCSRLANVGIWPLTNRRPRVVGPASVLGRTLTYSIVCRFYFVFINTFIWYIPPPLSFPLYALVTFLTSIIGFILYLAWWI